MNRRILSIIFILAGVVAALSRLVENALRWRPHRLYRHAAEIAQLVEGAPWVSPGIAGNKPLYLISFRDCSDCVAYEKTQFPRLQRQGVDTRVILFAARTTSTPAERSTVAELWANRSWKTLQAWNAVPSAAWTAPGIPSADADPARAALVEKSRQLVDRLTPLLADNGIRIAYPVLIWRDTHGALRGCACENRRTDRFVRAELGVR